MVQYKEINRVNRTKGEKEHRTISIVTEKATDIRGVDGLSKAKQLVSKGEQPGKTQAPHLLRFKSSQHIPPPGDPNCDPAIQPLPPTVDMG